MGLYKHTRNLRAGLESRGIHWEYAGNQCTRWMWHGHVYVANVEEPSGEVILKTYPHTLDDVFKEIDGARAHE